MICFFIRKNYTFETNTYIESHKNRKITTIGDITIEDYFHNRYYAILNETNQ